MAVKWPGGLTIGRLASADDSRGGLQAVAGQLVEQALARQTEPLRRLRLVPAGGGEGGGELAALERGELGVERVAGRVLLGPRLGPHLGPCAAQRRRQILDEDLVATTGDDQRALHL